MGSILLVTGFVKFNTSVSVFIIMVEALTLSENLRGRPTCLLESGMEDQEETNTNEESKGTMWAEPYRESLWKTEITGTRGEIWEQKRRMGSRE